METEVDHTFKIIIAGEDAVGKTTMFHQYIEGRFLNDTKRIIGVEFFIKELTVINELCELHLWDFGDQGRFKFSLDDYIIDAQGAFLMFDLTNSTTFHTLNGWLNIVRKYDPNLPVLLIGSKLDLKDRISVKDELALQFKLDNSIFDFIKVSSKTGFNIEFAFERLTQAIINKSQLDSMDFF